MEIKRKGGMKGVEDINGKIKRGDSKGIRERKGGREIVIFFSILK